MTPDPLSYESASDALPTPTPPTPSLGDKVTRGIAWGTIGAVLGKAISFVGNLILAKLLFPADLGLAQLALSVMLITGVVRDGGVAVVMMSRRDDFDRLASDSLWLFAILGVLATVLMVGAAPVMARVFNEPSLRPLVLILSLTVLPSSLLLPSYVRLSLDMRFGFLTAVNLITSVGTNVVIGVMAWLGYGPYSVIWAMVWLAVGKFGFFVCAAPVRPRWPAHGRTMWWLFTTGLWTMGLTALTTATGQGDYFLLGLFHDDKAVVGTYTLAFGLSIQTAALVWTAFGSVLLPAFSTLTNEPQRQAAAFFRSTRLLAFVALPLCVAQALAAEPLLRLFFGHKWDDAIVPLQLLSVGTAGSVVGLAVTSLFQAQGRFKALFALTATTTALFFVLVTVAAALGGATAVASAVTVYYWAAALVGVIAATGRKRFGRAELWTIFARPLLLSAVAAAAGLGVYAISLRTGWWIGVAMGNSLIMFGLAYVLLARTFMRGDWDEFMTRANGLIAPVRKIVRRIRPVT